MNNMLVIEHLNKTFQKRTVLNDVTFSVPEGSIFGFVGKNGAGKTTTMKAILGLYKIDGGEIIVNGEKVEYGDTKTNRYVGYLPDVPQFYNFYTPREYLTFCGRISGMKFSEIKPRVDEMLELVGLADENKKIKGFSRGMKQRLGIAQALLAKPKLLICDEPTSALDPVGRKDILDILVAAKKETTILFSTHILSDVERICDNIAFLHEGNIILSGSMKEIRNKHKNDSIEIEFQKQEDVLNFLRVYKQSKRLSENKLSVMIKGQEEREQLLTYLIEQHMEFESIRNSEWNLEEMFMEVVCK